MHLKHILLGSVSIAAVGSSAAVFQAKAQEAVQLPAGFEYSLEGAWLMGKNNVAEDKLGSGGSTVTDIQDNAGVRGALSAGIRVDDKWSFELGASANQMFDSHSTFTSGGPFGGGFTTNFSFQNLDFGAAFAPVLSDKFDVKLFAGIRGLHYTDTQDKVGVSSGGSSELNYKAEFIGAGPRIGVSGSARFGESPLGVSGMLAAAVIYGEERTNATAQFISNSGGGSGLIPVQSGTKWKSVYDVEASLGLDYHVNEQTKFTLGFRGEQISGVSGGPSGGPTTRLVYGPFAKVSGSF